MALGSTELLVIVALLVVFFGGAILAFVMRMVAAQNPSRKASRGVPARRLSNPMWPLVFAAACLALMVAGLGMLADYVFMR